MGLSRPVVALAAAALMSFTLGSIHAFSLFIAPLEARLVASRAEVSLVYACALLCLTAAVLVGHRLFGRVPAGPFALAVGLIGASGLLLAAQAEALWLVVVGYSLLFGGANGLGYGFCLQIGSRALPARAGLAMGLVTAVYALGATSFAQLFALLIDQEGAPFALRAVAAVLVANAALSGALLYWSRIKALAVSGQPSRGAIAFDRTFWRLWAGYGLAVAAGLMALGHAAGIVAAAGGSAAQLVTGTMLIGLGNALGGLAVALVADRWALGRLLAGLPLFSAVCLLGQTLVSGGQSALAGLTFIGLAYGAIIALYPYAVARVYGPARYPSAYGKVFTAWGLAGLAAPYLAGLLYDTTGGYQTALLLAALAAAASAGLTFRLSVPDS